MKLSNIAKKLIDISLSIFIFIFLSPILVLATLTILALEGSPAFYISKRHITPKKCITILKFRTMVKDAASEKHQLNQLYMRDGYLDIPLDSMAYTPVGRILERTQLVESLQLINICMGKMSLVGNRPLPMQNVELLKQFSGWEERFQSPAGITGISQIAGKYNLTPEKRLYLERMYSSLYNNLDANTLICDFFIIYHTFVLLFSGKYLGYDSSLALLMKYGASENIPESIFRSNGNT